MVPLALKTQGKCYILRGDGVDSVVSSSFPIRAAADFLLLLQSSSGSSVGIGQGNSVTTIFAGNQCKAS